MKNNNRVGMNIFCYMVMVCSFYLSPVFGRELCRAQVDCPMNFDGDTVFVDYNAVMLSEIFEHCAPDSVKEDIIDTTDDTISLFIIIDHSSSMKFMDPNNSRYKVVNDLIDSIYAYSPASEIGIAVFSNKLMHNFNNDSFFNVLDNSQAQGWNDSYVPLTRLDSQVGGVSAVEKLKWAIALSDTLVDQNGCKIMLQGDYGTSGRRAYTGGTDISIGFEAAKEAFQTAAYEKKRQFIIFLSDGEHQFIDTLRQPNATDYIRGQGVPTTFTAFFITQNQPIPDEIDTMTINIQNNGYSENNSYSEVWGTQTEVSEFFQKLLTNIIGDGLKYFTSTPISLTVNGVTTTTFDDTFAVFDPFFVPLSKAGTATLTISYTWHWDPPINKDVTREYNVVAMHGNNTDVPSVDCWNQGRIVFYESTGGAISVAGPSQTLLEVRFFPPDSGMVPPIGNTVGLELTNANASDKLALTLSLDPGTKTYYTTTFMRDYNIPVNDAILQNSNTDSIIAVYRNPHIPLDTVRYGIDVLPLLDLSVNDAYFFDQDADGHPDMIRLFQGGGQVLTTGDCSLIKPYTSIISPRNVGAPVLLIPDLHGFDISINEPTVALPGKTDLYLDANFAVNERVHINSGTVTVSSGNLFPFTDTTIKDKMAPVINSATYYDFPDSTSWDTLKVIFSEDVSSIVHNQPFLFENTLLDTSFLLNMACVRTDSNVVVFRVQPAVAAPPIQKGDSICINSSALVSDIRSNQQVNPLNIRRLLDYYHVYTLNSVIYLDTSASPDGLIDVVHVTTNVTLDSAMINALLANGSLTLPDHQNFIVAGIVAADSGFDILVSQPDGTIPVTGVDPLLDSLWVTTTVSVKNGIVFLNQLPIKDGIAPVITEAIFCPKFIQSEGATVYDTLIITFSETVVSPPYNTDKPFLFKYVVGGQQYTMVLQALGSGDSVQTFLVLSSDREFPETGDPVWINEIAGIKDLVGNIQDNPSNTPVPLKVKPYKFVTDVVVTNNPITNFNQTITVDGVTGKGLGIQVKIIGGWPVNVTMNATAHIYDVVGNELAEIAGTPSTSNKSILVFWDGLNTYNRKVADSIYLAYIKINSSQGLKKSAQIKIGVKRNQVY